MKLLLVTYGLNTVGGVQSWQHLFVHQLMKRGHKITILEMYTYSESKPDQRFDRKWDDEIKIIKLDGQIIQRGVNPRTNIDAIKVIFNFWKKARLENYISKERFDVILFPDPNFTFFLFSKTLKKNNCVVQFHNSFDRFKSTSHIRYWLTKWRIRSYKKFLFLSAGDAAKAIQNGFPPDKISFIYNFIDESRFDVFQKKDFTSRKQILIVGNLDIADKQIDHVLTAFSQIAEEKRKGWTIKVIGDGHTKPVLVTIAERLRILNCVNFVGKKSNPVIDFFESDFYVLSSSFEGFPLTLLECVFSNLPIISYECAPSIKEIVIDNVNGVIVARNDISALSDAMLYLITNPDVLKEMSENQTSLKQKFNSQIIIKQWEQLLSMGS